MSRGVHVLYGCLHYTCGWVLSAMSSTFLVPARCLASLHNEAVSDPLTLFHIHCHLYMALTCTALRNSQMEQEQ